MYYKLSRFPANQDVKKLWLASLHREDWEPSKTAVICSDHMKECDINRKGKRVFLKKGAIPTRFKGRASHPYMDDESDGSDLDNTNNHTAPPGLIGVDVDNDNLVDHLSPPSHDISSMGEENEDEVKSQSKDSEVIKERKKNEKDKIKKLQSKLKTKQQRIRRL